MAQKSTKKTTANKKSKITKEDILLSALNLASIHPWASVTENDIARKAGISKKEFFDLFQNKSDLISFYHQRIDEQLQDSFEELDESLSARDRLFDIFMVKFDILNQDREALISILKSVPKDPWLVLSNVAQIQGSMANILDLAGIESFGSKGVVRQLGLIALYGWVLRVWVNDSHRDMPKTMAELDKSLSRIENLADILNI